MKRMLWAAAAAFSMALSITGASVAHDGNDNRRWHDDFDGFEGGLRFEAVLSADQEVNAAGMPNVDSPARARATVWFDKGLTQVFVSVRIRGLVGTFGASHFHCNRPGSNGPVALGLVGPGPLTLEDGRLRGVLTNANFAAPDLCITPVGRRVNNVAALAFAMRDGLVYLNVHTNAFPGGEIRGQLIEHEDSGRW